MQLGVIYITTELLQLAKLRMACELFQTGNARSSPQDAEDTAPHYDNLDLDGDDARIPLPTSDANAPDAAVRRRLLASASPDLHGLGRLFLSEGARVVFDIAVFFHFIFILISYALAGSQSVATLVTWPVRWCVTLFVVVFTTVVVGLAKALQPIIALFTVVKAVIFLSIIIVVGVASHAVNVGPTSDWPSVLQPFLVGTVALGGVVNL